jgi:hypothetical protein
MKNMTMHVNGNKLVIEVDLSQDLGPSKSGKTVLIASSEGKRRLPRSRGRQGRAERLPLPREVAHPTRQPPSLCPSRRR